MWIVTHTSPDWDAIGYAWLMRRWGGASEAEIRFVNTGSPDPEVLAGAWSVGDTGRVFDPAARRFDHHQLPGRESNETCATLMTYEWLAAQNNTPEREATRSEIEAIHKIVALIYQGDTGLQTGDIAASRLVGIHALLAARLKRGESDEALVAWGCAVLDDLADLAIARKAAARMLHSYTAWRSMDGLVVALEDAPREATGAAFEDGAAFVFFASEDRGSIARGVQRGRSENALPHAGELIGLAAEATSHPGVTAELRQWYLHPAGFFAGRGTAKAPCYEAMTCDIADIAIEFSRMWVRE